MERQTSDEKSVNAKGRNEVQRELLSALPTENDKFLNKMKENYIADSIKVLTEAAKQVITVIPIIISILTFAVGYIKTQNLLINSFKFQLLLVVTFVSLILSIVSSMVSIVPLKVKMNIFEIGNIEQITNRRIRKKYLWVIISYIFLVVSLTIMSILYLWIVI
jgi:hypothetical protein